MSHSEVLTRLLSGASVPALEHDDMVHVSKSGVCHIVDVREPHEYAAGHVPGAVNHPLSAFDASALPKDKPVVLLCQAGGRSAKALAQALTAGRKDVTHYAPGTGGWKARGEHLAM